MQVDLLDHSGSDLIVVNAARTSFDRESSELDDRDIRLLNFLAREKHVLPFRHPQVTLRIHAPLFVIRQLDKHQVGFSTSEVSRRYITKDPEFYIPQWREAAEDKKQGSAGSLDAYEDYSATRVYIDLLNKARQAYTDLLTVGVAPEQARMALPQSMYTTQVKTGSLLGWFHLVQLRLAPDAQEEVRVIANHIVDYMIKLYPESWKALEKHS